jgi:hypothetical protein
MTFLVKCIESFHEILELLWVFLIFDLDAMSGCAFVHYFLFLIKVIHCVPKKRF